MGRLSDSRERLADNERLPGSADTGRLALVRMPRRVRDGERVPTTEAGRAGPAEDAREGETPSRPGVSGRPVRDAEEPGRDSVRPRVGASTGKWLAPVALKPPLDAPPGVRAEPGRPERPPAEEGRARYGELASAAAARSARSVRLWLRWLWAELGRLPGRDDEEAGRWRLAEVGVSGCARPRAATAGLWATGSGGTSTSSSATKTAGTRTLWGSTTEAEMQSEPVAGRPPGEPPAPGGFVDWIGSHIARLNS